MAGLVTSDIGLGLATSVPGLGLATSDLGLGLGITNFGLVNITGIGKNVPDGLKPLLQCLKTVPISSAEAERGFSELNIGLKSQIEVR